MPAFFSPRSPGARATAPRRSGGSPGRRSVARFTAGEHDRGDPSEGNGVVHALGRRVERLGGLAFVEVVDQPAGEAVAGAGGDAARERPARREVAVAGTAAGGAAGRSRRSRPSQETSTRPYRDRRHRPRGCAGPPRGFRRARPRGRRAISPGNSRPSGARSIAGCRIAADFPGRRAPGDLVRADADPPATPLDEAAELTLGVSAPCRAVDRGRRLVRRWGGARWCGSSPALPLRYRSTTPRVASHTRTPSSKSPDSKRSRSNTLPLLRVTRTSRVERLDARDLAEARHEGPAELPLPLPDGPSPSPRTSSRRRSLGSRSGGTKATQAFSTLKPM